MSTSPLPAERRPLAAAVAGLEQAVVTLREVGLWQSSGGELLAALGRVSRVEARLAAVRLALVHPQSVVDGVAALPAALPADQVEEAEQTLLDHCRDRDPRQVVFLARHLRYVTDPDGAAALAREEARLECRRELFLTPVADGWVTLRGRLDAEAGALLAAALDPLSAPRPTGPAGPDGRAPARRRADALIELVQTAVHAGALPRTGGTRPTLVVTLDHTALTAQAFAAGLLATGHPRSPAALRRLACDAQLIPIVLGADSQPLDVGRSTYTCPPGPALRSDRPRPRLRLPGLPAPTRLDRRPHIVHWADGGATSLDNLCLLCGHHHRHLHGNTGWRIQPRPGGRPPFHPLPWIPRP